MKIAFKCYVYYECSFPGNTCSFYALIHVLAVSYNLLSCKVTPTVLIWKGLSDNIVYYIKIKTTDMLSTHCGTFPRLACYECASYSVPLRKIGIT